MGWQKRSIGNRYDSLSGHALMIGARTKKPINLVVMAKCCATCAAAEKKEEDPKEHKCPRNYEGSSKGMEATAALRLVKNQYEKNGLIVEYVVADDDSSMRATLRHSFREKQAVDPAWEWPRILGKRCRDVGKLPLDIPEPKFLADPTHRTKVAHKQIFAVVRGPKNQTPSMSLWGMPCG